MNTLKIFFLFALLSLLLSCGNIQKEIAPSGTQTPLSSETPAPMENPKTSISSYSLKLKDESVEIFPISHATFIAKWGDEVIYLDPAEALTAYP